MNQYQNRLRMDDVGWKEVGLLAAGLLGALWLGGQARQRMQRLDGQVVLITGGSRGLGFLLAREFARNGCRLALCARDEAELHHAARQLQRDGAEIFVHQCDVSNRDEVERMVKAVIRHYGQIDILVNNAGVIQVGPYATLKLSDFEQAMEIMFWGMLYPTFAVVPQMRQRGAGRIVNITSIGGKISVPHLLAYNSAKHAAVGFSEGLTAELAQYGIPVTTVVPGLMRTGSHVQAKFKGQREQEFTLFSALGNTPPFSINAERAARQIVAATKRGDAECIISLTAAIATRFHGLLPGTTIRLLTLVNGLLPQADEGRNRAMRGAKVWNRMPEERRQWLERLMPLGVRSLERYQPLEMNEQSQIQTKIEAQRGHPASA
jgi:short-subunit dehydrogenase